MSATTPELHARGGMYSIKPAYRQASSARSRGSVSRLSQARAGSQHLDRAARHVPGYAIASRPLVLPVRLAIVNRVHPLATAAGLELALVALVARH